MKKEKAHVLHTNDIFIILPYEAHSLISDNKIRLISMCIKKQTVYTSVLLLEVLLQLVHLILLSVSANLIYKAQILHYRIKFNIAYSLTVNNSDSETPLNIGTCIKCSSFTCITIRQNNHHVIACISFYGSIGCYSAVILSVKLSWSISRLKSICP